MSEACLCGGRAGGRVLRGRARRQLPRPSRCRAQHESDGCEPLHPVAMVARGRTTTLPAWPRRPRSTEFVALGHPGNDHFAGLETFANPGVADVELVSDELTAVCPITGQPDLYRIDDRLPPDGLLPRIEVAQALPELVPQRGRLLRGARRADPGRHRRRARAARRPGTDHARAEGARRDHDHRPCTDSERRAASPTETAKPRSTRSTTSRSSSCGRGAARSGRGTTRTCFRPGLPSSISRLPSRSARSSRPPWRATTPGTPISAGCGEAFAGFAAARFGWQVDPERVRGARHDVGGRGAAARTRRARRRGRGQPAGLPAVLPGLPRGRVPRRRGAAARRAPGRGSISTASSRRSRPARGPTCSATRTTRRARRSRASSSRPSRRSRRARGHRDRRRGSRPDDDAGREHVPFLSTGDAAAENGVALVSARRRPGTWPG